MPIYFASLHIICRMSYLIVTYFSVFKLWFTLRASARAVAAESSIPLLPITFCSRLWKRVLQIIKINGDSEYDLTQTDITTKRQKSRREYALER